MVDPVNPYLGFGLIETHAVELETYLIVWAKGKMGTEGHPLCKNGVAAAKSKAAPEADKPNDMTPKDRQNKHIKRQHQRSLRTTTQKYTSQAVQHKEAQAVQY
ncbi:MAG: hypothetical protein ACKPKO_42845, partial [Candidatus Fonsibacter sp.]